MAAPLSLLSQYQFVVYVSFEVHRRCLSLSEVSGEFSHKFAIETTTKTS